MCSKHCKLRHNITVLIVPHKISMVWLWLRVLWEPILLLGSLLDAHPAPWLDLLMQFLKHTLDTGRFLLLCWSPVVVVSHWWASRWDVRQGVWRSRYGVGHPVILQLSSPRHSPRCRYHIQTYPLVADLSTIKQNHFFTSRGILGPLDQRVEK